MLRAVPFIESELDETKGTPNELLFCESILVLWFGQACLKLASLMKPDFPIKVWLCETSL